MTNSGLYGIVNMKELSNVFSQAVAATTGGLLMMFSGGDFDDAIDVVDVWMYIDAPATIPETNVQETAQAR